MKIGVLVDGTAEASALQLLLSKICYGGRTFIKPLYADMQPLAPPAQIYRAAAQKLPLLKSRGAERTIVLLDREGISACPGDRAAAVRAEFVKHDEMDVSVVIKNRCFENWLIADPDGIRKAGAKRFNVSERIESRIRSAGADQLSAIAVLAGMVNGDYCKRLDPAQICAVACTKTMQDNSRSFRKFVKEISS